MGNTKNEKAELRYVLTSVGVSRSKRTNAQREYFDNILSGVGGVCSQ